MTPGMLVLTLLAVGVFCGLLQRVLDRMYLTDRQALLLIGIMLIGTFIPNIHLGKIALNVGGMIPAAICIYLMLKADTSVLKMKLTGEKKLQCLRLNSEQMQKVKKHFMI